MHLQTVHLAVDMMSGDCGLRLTIPAALQALTDYPQIHLHLLGEQKSLGTAMSSWPEAMRARAQICHAQALTDMCDQPTAVLRTEAPSSIHGCFEALASNQVAAVVSAGHAGVLMVLGRKLIGMASETGRPALCTLFPTATGGSLLLDLGANVDCSADQLRDFALLGSALFSSLYPDSSPRVALLSNGEEEGKGNAQVKQAAALLHTTAGINYRGYVEANNLHAGVVDVVVCDGFVGNIALKAIEGTARLSKQILEQLLSSNIDGGVTAEIAENLLADFSNQMNPDIHNGAFLLGLNGIVVKAHGDSSVEGFVASIGCALKCAEQNMIARMKTQLAGAQSLSQ